MRPHSPSELLVLDSRVEVVAVLANACGIDGFMWVYDDAVLNGRVFEHSHKLAHGHELPVLLGSLQSDGIFIVLMLRGLREKTGLNYQPSSTLSA
jgi:hypothetical protein